MSKVGMYGEIPNEIIKNKYEQTRMYDEPDYRQLMRTKLTDYSCDRPFLAQDEKRESVSHEIMGLRFGGGRSNIKPWAPDQDLSLRGRDPRGTLTTPRFNVAADMTRARKDSYKFYSTSSYQRTEAESSGASIIQKLKDNLWQVKERLKIFSTSKDNMMYASAKQNCTAVVQDMVDKSGKFDPLKTECQTRLAKHYRNELTLGWDQVADHEFKVAKFSNIRQVNPNRDAEALSKKAELSANQNDSELNKIRLAKLMAIATQEHATIDHKISERNNPLLPYKRRAITENRLASDIEITQMQTDSGCQKNIQGFTGEVAKAETETSAKQMAEFMNMSVRTAKKDADTRAVIAEAVASASVGTSNTATIGKIATAIGIPIRESDVSAHLNESKKVANLRRRLDMERVNETQVEAFIDRTKTQKNTKQAEQNRINNNLGNKSQTPIKFKDGRISSKGKVNKTRMQNYIETDADVQKLHF